MNPIPWMPAAPFAFALRHMAIATITLAACAALAKEPLDDKAKAPNPEWIALFDGKSFDGWTNDEGKAITEGWVVKDGMIIRTGRGGYLVTTKHFADFELVVEWKVGPRSNSGIKYRVKDYGKYELGCEYQIIDGAGYHEPLAPWQRTGALYALYAPPRSVKPNPIGTWNCSRIVAHGSHIEHWLNGKQIVKADTSSDDWKRRVLQSKFDEYPNFGQNRTGPIKIQDHGGEVWFRKIVLRVLD